MNIPFMRGKIISVCFRHPGEAGEWTCADGEIADSVNVRVSSGSGFPEGSGENGVEDGSGFQDGSSAFTSALSEAPKVEFGLARRVVAGWQNHLSNPPSAIVAAGTPSEEGWGARAMETLVRYCSDAMSQGLFVAPFLAIYAFRMHDGSRILPGPPVLMIPNSSAPEIGANGDWESAEMKMTVAAAACSLQFRVGGSAEVKASGCGITHLDILVSLPVMTYDQKGEPVCRHRRVPAVFSHSLGPDGKCREHRVCGDSFPVGWQAAPLSPGLIGAAIADASEFRLLSSVPLSSLSDSDDFSDVVMNCGSPDSLGSCEAYSPDYAHLQGIAADYSRMVSGRLTLCGLHLTLPAPFPPSVFSPRSDGVSDSGRERTAVEVETVKDGEVLRCSLCAAGEDSEYLAAQPPRWAFYPDPDARKLTAVTPSGSWSVDLRRHPKLHGSYYYGGLGIETAPGFSIGGSILPEETPAACVRATYNVPSGIWRSEVGNRFFFPRRLLARLEIGRAIALCRAFRASGLIATTSPTLYLFTDEGVFLLKEMADGSLRDAGLIGAYVLRDSCSFRVGGGSVEFVDESGNLLRIEGTKIKPYADTSASSSPGREAGMLLISAENPEEDVVFSTRVLKLGSPCERKRIGAVELIGTGEAEGFLIVLSGSDNLRDWREIARSSLGRLSGLWQHRYRYFRVSISGRLAAGESLEGLLFRLRE